MSVGTVFLGGGDSYMDSLGRIINNPRVYTTPMYMPPSDAQLMNEGQTQRLQMLLPLLSGLFGGGASGASGGLGGFNTNYGASGNVNYNSGIQSQPVMGQPAVNQNIQNANAQLQPNGSMNMPYIGRAAQNKLTGDQSRMGIAAGQTQGNAFARNAAQVNTQQLNQSENARANSGIQGAGILQGLNQGMTRAYAPVKQWGIGQVLKNI